MVTYIHLTILNSHVLQKIWGCWSSRWIAMRSSNCPTLLGSFLECEGWIARIQRQWLAFLTPEQVSVWGVKINLFSFMFNLFQSLSLVLFLYFRLCLISLGTRTHWVSTFLWGWGGFESSRPPTTPWLSCRKILENASSWRKSAWSTTKSRNLGGCHVFLRLSFLLVYWIEPWILIITPTKTTLHTLGSTTIMSRIATVAANAK